jgi:hypothetical protein
MSVKELVGEIRCGKERIQVKVQDGITVLPETDTATEIILDRLNLKQLDLSPLHPGDDIHRFSLRFNGIQLETINLGVLSWNKFGSYGSYLDMEGTQLGYLDLRPLNKEANWHSQSQHTIHTSDSDAILPITDEPLDITPLIELNTWISASKEHHLRCDRSSFISRFNQNVSTLLASWWEISEEEYTEEDYNRDMQEISEIINKAAGSTSVNWEDSGRWNDNHRGEQFISGYPRIDLY